MRAIKNLLFSDSLTTDTRIGFTALIYTLTSLFLTGVTEHLENTGDTVPALMLVVTPACWVITGLLFILMFIRAKFAR